MRTRVVRAAGLAAAVSVVLALGVHLVADQLDTTTAGTYRPATSSGAPKPVLDTRPATADPGSVATWRDVEGGSGRQPTIVIDGSVYPNSRGVQFVVNGVVDERSPSRPDGYDATGPQDGSTFHVYPSIDLSIGDTIEARWVDGSSVAQSSQLTVDGAVSTPPPTPPTPPTPDPDPTPLPPIDGDFPTPDSTGPRVPYSQMTVVSGFESSYDGQVIEMMDIRGQLRIKHRNVIVRDVRVMANGNFAVDLRKNSDGSCPTATLEYIEIDGRNTTENDIPMYSNGCAWTLDHALIHNVGRATKILRNNVVSNSYIHSSRTGDSGAHRAAIGLNGGSNNKLINNTLICEGSGCSAALANYGDIETVSDLLVERNFFAATAGFCAYGGSSSSKPHPDAENVRFIDNHFSTMFFPECGRAGFITGWDGGVRGNIASGNVIHETGQLLSFNTQ